MSVEVEVRVPGIQRWITGGFTELRLVRGGSLLLQDLFERQIPKALNILFGRATDADWRSFDLGKGDPWQPMKAVSGSLDVLVGSDEDARRVAGEATAVSRRMGLIDLPLEVSIHRYGTESTTPASATGSWMLGLCSPPGAEPCQYSGVAPVAGLEHGIPAGTSVLARSGAAVPADAHESHDMTAIGNATRSRRFSGYVAVVLADGDGIGKRVRAAVGAGAAALWSLNQDLFTETATLVAAAKAAGLATLGDGFLWNPVIIGGDDITVVVPADAGPAVALALSGQPTTEDGRNAMSASASILIVSSSFPFHLARHQSESLLDTAKRVAQSANEPHIALAFEVGSVRGQDRWPASASPYSRSELTALVQAATHTGLSNSQLRTLAGYSTIGGRVIEREWALTADTALEAMAVTFDPSGGSPCTIDRSPIGDLVDIVALLRSGELDAVAEDSAAEGSLE